MANSASKNQTVLENYFKSAEEPKFLDALWTGESVFKVGVLMTALAEMVMPSCLSSSNSKGLKGKDVLVRVIDL